MPYLGRAPTVANNVTGDLAVSGAILADGQISAGRINHKLALNGSDGASPQANEYDHFIFEDGGTDGSGTNAGDNLLLEDVTPSQFEILATASSFISTGLSSDKDMRALALEVSDVKGAALNFPNGAADPFDSDTLATKTNATYSASDDYYHNPGTGYTDSFITSGLTFTGETGGGNDVTNLANLADDNTGTEATVPVPLPAGSRFIKIDLGSGVTKTATKMTIHWQNHSDIANYLLGVTLEGSNNDSDYTSLINEETGGTANTPKDYTWSNTTAYRYYKLTVKSKNTSSGATNANIIELDMFETAVTQDMTLINSGLTASSPPSTGFITVQADPVDSVAANTDIKAFISRDGGTTFSEVTLADGAINSNFINYEGSVDISGQPSGTSMKYKVTTHNTKEIRVSGVVLRFS